MFRHFNSPSPAHCSMYVGQVTFSKGTTLQVYMEVPPQALFLLSRQKNVRTANADRTALLNESNSNKWKQNMDFFYLHPLPTKFLYQ